MTDPDIFDLADEHDAQLAQTHRYRETEWALATVESYGVPREALAILERETGVHLEHQ